VSVRTAAVRGLLAHVWPAWRISAALARLVHVYVARLCMQATATDSSMRTPSCTAGSVTPVTCCCCCCLLQNACNVLVSSSRTAPYGLVAKLADLGLSRAIKQHSMHRTTNTVSRSNLPDISAAHAGMLVIECTLCCA
jgi:hypothetical protein